MTQVVSITKKLNNNASEDFQKQDIKFDIKKLRDACNQVLKIRGF